MSLESEIVSAQRCQTLIEKDAFFSEMVLETRRILPTAKKFPQFAYSVQCRTTYRHLTTNKYQDQNSINVSADLRSKHIQHIFFHTSFLSLFSLDGKIYLFATKAELLAETVAQNSKLYHCRVTKVFSHLHQ